jgi:hypothetical protein
MGSDHWFEVDRAGLAQIVRRRGSAFLALELLANAWDTDATKVEIGLASMDGKPLAWLTVVDNDPHGFERLSDAYTLYAPSCRRGDPTKRGRFNIGEKEVLSLCQEARITSMNGGVVFAFDGTRRRSKDRTLVGTEFSATVRLTRADLDEVTQAILSVLPPAGVTTRLNGAVIEAVKPQVKFEVSLPTELQSEDGSLRPTKRKAVVAVIDPNGEPSYLYELGIPVCELPDDPWHIDVQQKVPLPRDRDAVRPSYLHKLRVAVLNHCHEELNEEEASQSWVADALEDDDVETAAVETIVERRYGKKRVVFDLHDPEATKRAASEGYAVIHGGAFGKKAWERIREEEVAKPAGKVFPTSKPEFTPDGEDARIPDGEWTDGMRAVAKYAEKIGESLMGFAPVVNIVRDPHNRKFQAWYGGQRLSFNLLTCGHKFFNEFPANIDAVNDLLIHEFGHEYSNDHLNAEYHGALTRLGAKMVRLALDKPRMFKPQI